ncbi:MAG: hypothetical protein DMG84_22630, partial [Acidobacteria bacterium]
TNLAPTIGGTTLVQHTSKDAGTTTSSSLAFNLNNTTGNWIAVVIRAGRSGQVFTVTDSRRNTYHQAVQFNVTVDGPNGDTLGIFYAENIAGGANTITVSDTISGTLRFAILEYSGVALANSMDGTAATAQGISASPNSGNLTTTASGDLLLGANLTGNPTSFTAGSGYSVEEAVPAKPNTKLIAEDQIQLAAGTASASALLGASDSWAAALAAFKSVSLNVAVSPRRAAVTMSALQTVQFTATVFNDPSNSGVVWSVDNNNGGTATSGTISTAGLYTPGSLPGVHTITATSVANAAVSASSSVAVTDLAGVYMHHNDVQRTGQNLQEYALTPANVGSSAFTKLFSCPTDGYVYAQPLWVANLTVGGVNRNVLFLATEHDSVYAYDADSPSCILLWKTSFLGTNVTTMSWQDTVNGATDLIPEIGITSTPVIDAATKTIYVVAKTKETIGTGCPMASPCYVNRLHALDVTTGAEKFGGPVVISATNFDSRRHFNRPALLLNNGTVYVAFGSHADGCNWQGWLFGYDAASLTQKFVQATADPTSGCNGAAIWDGGAGPASDASGNVYVITGNGTYNGTTNFSESTLKYSPSGTLLDWFTPFNRSVLDANDVDMGSAGVLILPDSVASAAHPHLALATGKIDILYLLDISQPGPGQTTMGKFNSTTNNDVQEVIPVPPPNTTLSDGGNYGVPAFWNGNIYTTGQNYPLSQFTIASGSILTPAFAVSTNTFPPRGATPSVSASGTINGVVWVLDISGWTGTGSAVLYAYDATNVANMLYSSPASGTAAAGAAVKFTVPTVANGKVYVPGQSTVSVFGLLPN